MTELNRADMQRIVEARRIANEERAANHSRSQLTRHIETKMKTTMIGALAKFEENFGSLWGHGLDDSELTDVQRQYKELWNLTRTEILNNGNNQLRAAKDEINCYTVKFNKFETEFIIKDSQELTTDE